MYPTRGPVTAIAGPQPFYLWTPKYLCRALWPMGRPIRREGPETQTTATCSGTRTSPKRQEEVGIGFKRVPDYPHSVGKVAAALSKLTDQEEGLLHVLRDLQPLIVLASFSLVIGTFAAPSSPTAAGYAIGASMAFLTAFIILLTRKVLYASLRKTIEPD